MAKSKLKATQLVIVDDINEYIVHEFEKQGLVVKTKEQLKSAISKLSSSEGTIIVVDNIIIDENITVPKNVMLKFYKGGKLTVNSGFTLTLDCAIDAGLFHIFDGNGTIDLSKAVKSVITVDTIKELVLKTANINGIGCNVNVLGYHEPGDGGGGYFYWDANEDKANHNGGTIIDPNIAFPTDWNNTTQQSAWFTAGTGSGCWKRIYSGDVNVKWFGAKGDGVTDDTEAIQNALNNGKYIYFPEGNYKISSPLYLNENQIIYGNNTNLISYSSNKTLILNNNVQILNLSISGQANTLNDEILIYGENISNIIINNVTLSNTIFGIDLYNCKNAKILNSTISNIKEKGIADGGIGILLVNTLDSNNDDKSIISNNYLNNIDSVGIYISNRTNSIIINNNILDNIRYHPLQTNTVNGETQNIIIYSNLFINSSASEIIMLYGKNSNIIISKNILKNNSTTRNGTIVCSSNSNNILINNNIIQNNNSTNDIYIYNSNYIKIKNNFISNSIYIGGTSKYINIENNKIETSNKIGIRTTSTTSNIIINNNNLINNLNHIYIDSNYTKINGNVCENSLQKGIIVASNSCIISDNIVINSGTETTDTYAQIQNLGNYNIISNNTLYSDGTSHYDIFIEAGDYNLITNNMLHNSLSPFKIYFNNLLNNTEINNIT